MEEIVKSKVVVSPDPLKIPDRIAVFPKTTPVKYEVEKPDEKLVMTFPDLIIREVMCFQVVVIILALVSLFVNAPLEGLANPQNTPNPAKAPWYFLGLQELLHSFPPVVAGVIIPTLVVIALVIIPYFNVNIKREGLWIKNPKGTFIKVSIVCAFVIIVTIFYDTFTITIPTVLLYIIVVLPLFIKTKNQFVNWLSKRSLSEWIMVWFVLIATVLTIIGTYFRGAGWSWVWPW
jgi:menaquinol-cytochrome c reductase cytochrome b/c subunit